MFYSIFWNAYFYSVFRPLVPKFLAFLDTILALECWNAGKHRRIWDTKIALGQKPWKIQCNQTKTDYRTWKMQWKSPKTLENTMRILIVCPKALENTMRIHTCAKNPENWENPEVKARSFWQHAIFKFSFMRWIFCLSSTYAFLWFVFLSCFGPHLTLNLPLLVLFFFDVVFCFLGFFCYKETRKANFLHFYRVWVFCSPTPLSSNVSFCCLLLFFLLISLAFSSFFLPFQTFIFFLPFSLCINLPFFILSLFQSFFLLLLLAFFFSRLWASFFPNHFPEGKKAPTHNSNSGVCPEMPRKQGKIDKHVYFS